MIDLTTKYMGFQLKNPLIVASSGLTKSPEKIKEFEDKGIAAVVLKSIFEEQIMVETNHIMEYTDSYNNYPEALDYIKNFSMQNSVGEYLKLIRDIKKEVKIPVFASINCVSMNEWIAFARDIENAGADGLELNIFIMPGNLNATGAEHEKMYFDIIEKIKKTVKIPVALKIGYYFSGLVNLLQKFSWSGIASLVMFNRFYTPDINIDTLHIQTSNILSTPAEIGNSLRWIALLSDKAGCDISASTGIHDASGVIKQLLVGATTTQLCSTLYINGSVRIQEILEDMTKWMEQKKYHNISDFRGKLSLKKADNPVLYHRVQYMKHLSDIN
jgi:dihydroorotate dehydrogenase (fumarate)